ncbi:Ubiquitin carboxyl-terminal hydrolase 16 [Apiospora rasikravindrae]|uniref:Ubiquitin carboxyl-terminal hydrolase n=1 Tax=Apiospora rasikravindrae TaxID=990691 RepID=A0ABR1TCW1_9PEZI
MPAEKPLTVATYAAGASLAAITLVYVFAPTYLIDNEPNITKKKGVVGLTNPANDCFINSVLQALAGLTDLRVYLIRETHRRNIDEPWVYRQIVNDPSQTPTPDWKTEGLQTGLVTKGLKEILDALNERPIYKKTISATGFVKVLEVAFKQRISRQQQDAQEFLQVVAERLCDEYHAGRTARRNAREGGGLERSATNNSSAPIDGSAVEERLAGLAVNGGDEEHSEHSEQPSDSTTPHTRTGTATEDTSVDDDEEGFPLEGKFESQIECQTCHFKPRPTASTFCSLTLSVPQTSSTTLNACLDGMFKTEYVEDFKCEKCRLVHAKEVLEAEMAKSTSESFKAETRAAIEKLQHAIDTDPETPPADVVLPDTKYSPKRKIARHTRLTSFPKIMAIHLSRSIYDASMSTKNSAKVAFPEQLGMGGIINQRKYKLLGIVSHKGSHHSGHYESFRRQNVALPFSTPHAFQPSHAFTKSAQPSPITTPQVATPQIRALQKSETGSPTTSSPDLLSPTSGTSSSNPSVETLPREAAEPAPRSSPTSSHRKNAPQNSTTGRHRRESDTISIKSVAASAKSTLSKISQSARNSRTGSPAGKRATNDSTATAPTVGMPVAPAATQQSSASKTSVMSKRRKQSERWWRISDEKIKEAKTSDVLSMQKEVYLLFYELERESPAAAES